MIRPKEYILEDILAAMGGTPSAPGTHPIRPKEYILEDILARLIVGADLASGVVVQPRATNADFQLTPEDQMCQWVTPACTLHVALPVTAPEGKWAFTIHHAGTDYILYVDNPGVARLAELIPGGSITCVWDGTTLGFL